MKPRNCKISNISKLWVSVCIVIAKFILRQNITSACSQEATAVVNWLFLFGLHWVLKIFKRQLYYSILHEIAQEEKDENIFIALL